MRFFSFFKKRASATTARERLQTLLAHERASIGGSDLVSILAKEILAVVATHVKVDNRQVRISMNRGMRISNLVVDVDIPFDPNMRAA